MPTTSELLQNAIVAQNSLTQVVNEKLAAINDAKTSFINSFALLQPTTILVGNSASANFSTIQAAVDSLKFKIIKSPVVIQVADGTYDMSILYISGIINPEMVKILGNKTNPANCVLNFKADSTGKSHGIVVDGVKGINISGFTIKGGASSQNWTYRGLLATNLAIVFCDDASIAIDGTVDGLVADNSSLIVANGATLKAMSANLNSRNSSSIVAETSKFYGQAKTFILTDPTTLVQLRSINARCENLGQIFVGKSTFYGGYINVASYRNAIAHCAGGAVSDGLQEIGVYADLGSQIWFGLSATDALSQGGGSTGFYAKRGSKIYCPYSKAVGATNGFIAEDQSYIFNDDGGCPNCQNGYISSGFSLISALRTSANSTGATTKYSPATSGLLGNYSGQVIFS